MLLSTAATPRKNNKQIVLHTANTVNFRGTVTADSVTAVQLKIDRQAKRLHRSKPLYLVINSPGGSIDAGEQLIEFLKGYPNVKVVCIFCASMAHAILQAVNNERLVLASSTLMAHRARLSGIGGQIESGELESRLIMIKKIVRSMEIRNAKRIGISLKKYKARVINEWWVSGKEIIKLNHADRIVEIKCTTGLIQSKESTTVRSLFGSRTVKTSKCPLINGQL